MKGAVYLKRVSTNMPTHFHEWHISGEGWKERIMKAERKKKTSVAGGDKKASESKTRALWPRPSRGVTLRAASCHLSRTKCSSQTPQRSSQEGPCKKAKSAFFPKRWWNLSAQHCHWGRAVPETFISCGAHHVFSADLSNALGLAQRPTNSHSSHELGWKRCQELCVSIPCPCCCDRPWLLLIARPGCSSKEQQIPQMNTQIQCGGNQVQSQNKLGVYISFLSPEQWLSSGGKVRFARKHEPLSVIISYNKVSRGTRRLFRALLQILVPTKSNVRQTLTCVFKNKEQFAGLLTSFFPSKPRNQHILFPLLLQQLWA